jgi:hypothetical protein
MCALLQTLLHCCCQKRNVHITVVALLVHTRVYYKRYQIPLLLLYYYQYYMTTAATATMLPLNSPHGVNTK